ncbi:PTS glucitol/sorbitol transporter subunit IIB [Acidipropionibacterium thoenii]|uniref:PTS glucitol/sorbitol transporter subunit IIB n=1 Tax=Acidipropionibacterium thoenii TaxID=1751 RepID=UPI000487FE79|nr:PTS glucitol/sorbitol transporter subunit IIB [Acidipropionibacterium thoenii]
MTTDFPAVRINKGAGGWGPGLVVRVHGDRNIVLSVTGGDEHPVAKRIAELTGGRVVNAFNSGAPDDQVMCAVINCGGTARSGVYPKKRIPTVNVFTASPGGPLQKYITDDIYVSGVGVSNVETAEAGTPAIGDDGAETGQASQPPQPDGSDAAVNSTAVGEVKKESAFSRFIIKFGGAIGYVITSLLNAGREGVKLILNTVIPFMAYVALIMGIVNYTGLANWIARSVSPLAGSLWGLLLLGIITGLPILSPFLGPGAAIAQIIGVLMGAQIATGALPVRYALPTLFAIDGQVGCDFIPVGLSLGEAQSETVDVGVPAVLFGRQLTSPLAVLIAYGFSFLV